MCMYTLTWQLTGVRQMRFDVLMVVDGQGWQYYSWHVEMKWDLVDERFPLWTKQDVLKTWMKYKTCLICLILTGQLCGIKTFVVSGFSSSKRKGSSCNMLLLCVFIKDCSYASYNFFYDYIGSELFWIKWNKWLLHSAAFNWEHETVVFQITHSCRG